MRFALLTLLWLSCTAPSDTRARRDEILGGAPDALTTTVFLLDLRFDTGGSAICSAVLISPRVLLTAAHCVDPVFHSARVLTARATNKADTVMLMQSDMIDITTTALHPTWDPGVTQSDYDLAMVLLVRAPGVTSDPLQRTPPSSGQSIRVVGYGRTSASGAASSGTRRTVTAPIVAVSATDFTLGSSGALGICAGDSGGPSFLGEAVAGIHSNADANCGRGTDIRVDTNLAFIEGFINTNDPPSCSADGRCAPGCGATLDPDCPCKANAVCEPGCGLTDPDCADDGAVCTAAAQCASAQCIDDSRGFQFCSRTCAATSDCQNEMTCQTGVCRAAPTAVTDDPVKGGCSSVSGLWLMLAAVVLLRNRPGRLVHVAPVAHLPR